MTEVHAVLAQPSIPSAERAAGPIFRGKSMEEPRIGMECAFAAVELAAPAQYDFSSTLNCMHCPTNVNRFINQLVEIAHGFFVFAGSENKKVTICVGSLRTAYVQKMNSIRCIYHAIHMRGNADIYSYVL